MPRVFRHAFCHLLSAFLAIGLLGACGGSSSQQPTIQDKYSSRATKEAASSYAPAVQELYVAYFGRPADPAGLANFESALAAAGAPTTIEGLTSAYATNPAVQSLIDSFGTSKESQTLYGGGGTQAFVTAVFQNVLGRVPASAGLAYWTNAISSGSLSQGDAALAIMDGALTNNTTQGQLDAQLVNNRLAVAAAFTAQVASQGATTAYSGAASAASARGMLSQVDADTSVSSFSTNISAEIAVIVQGAPGISLLAGDIRGGVSLNTPAGLVRDASGNLYVTDMINNVVDKIAPDGTFTVFAGTIGNSGSADGIGAAASFNAPYGIGIDSKGNIYVADSGNQTIRKITPSGVVSTFAGTVGQTGEGDGVGQSATFYKPSGLAIDSQDNIYVGDTGYFGTIRKISPSGVVASVSGSGSGCPGPANCFGQPVGLALDQAGNLYIADNMYATVRKMSPGGVVSIVAGTSGIYGAVNGPAASATFCNPTAVVVDAAGNIFVTDSVYVPIFAGSSIQYDFAIREISPNGMVSTVAGQAGNYSGFVNGSAGIAEFSEMLGLTLDGSGNLIIADSGNSSIRVLSGAGVVSTFVGQYGFTGSNDGSGAAAGFYQPEGLTTDAAGNVYVADSKNDTIRKITSSGVVTTFVGPAQIHNITPEGGLAGALNQPVGLAMGANGNMYVSDTQSGSIDLILQTGVVQAFATGNSVFANGQNNYFDNASGIAVDSSGNVFVSDSGSCDIRKVAADGSVTPFAGYWAKCGSTDGPALTASFQSPAGIALDSAGNVYVADSGNNTIRVISTAGITSTLAGKAGVAGLLDGAGNAALFNNPIGLAIDANGNLYVADSGNNVIRMITPTGVVSTVAGTPGTSSNILGALPGGLYKPQYLTLVGNNMLYVTTANAVLRIQLP